ncbi:hypothetical protein N7468_001853 [Penicillium chermesinum]|uniref:Uncharacterized protein n=1 Tax=Penicillium chermesinum TaxID=63820 RepID=A0A9W9PHJ6_9EURO|nr:uncharacterized protein N7468_001853 [Penicillium chermesinum]KAJ5246870.1 hypothetical protein N7468_001853 [Penicillium chermesinum]KAJ6145126.1 hypothetical protein N7470_009021 [Penicillium chermesinum]
MPPRNEKRAGFHTRLFRSSQMFGSTDSDLVPGNDDEYGTNGFARELGSRPPAEQNRASRMTRTLIRRRSSEEFRRRISQIFNESIHMNLPTGRLEFDPKLRDLHGRRIRESILEHFRSQHDETQVQQELPEET